MSLVRNCTLATNAVTVAEWFDRAWLQIFVNDLAPPTLQTVLVGAYNALKRKVVFRLNAPDNTTLWWHQVNHVDPQILCYRDSIVFVPYS